MTIPASGLQQPHLRGRAGSSAAHSETESGSSCSGSGANSPAIGTSYFGRSSPGTPAQKVSPAHAAEYAATFCYFLKTKEKQ